MKIELEGNFFYDLKDAVYTQFLKDDLETVKLCLKEDTHPDDVKYNKKLIKAYKRILKYYGVNND